MIFKSLVIKVPQFKVPQSTPKIKVPIVQYPKLCQNAHQSMRTDELSTVTSHVRPYLFSVRLLLPERTLPHVTKWTSLKPKRIGFKHIQGFN